MRPTQRVAAMTALALVLWTLAPAAHEIPRNVTVHAFVKPEGQRLRVLLRVPLAAMRDMQFPERDGLLDVERTDPLLRDAVTQWILSGLELREGAEILGPATIAATRVSLPSDRSFTSYETALAHVTQVRPDPADTRLPWNQAMLDVLLEYPIRSEQSDFSVKPGFERLGVEVVTVLRFHTTGGIRAFEFRGDPGIVRLDPRWHQAAWHFVKLGFFHILDGIDHLLFLACLVIPLRRLRPLIIVVTAFTIAHSITLVASALGLAPDALWFPLLVETLIAASIVWLALENILTKGTAARRWIIAFAFGLVHGFGFSFALGETMQFAGAHLLTSLLAFNVGVEIGQVVVLLALVPALHLFFRVVASERAGIAVLSILIAHTAWHWMAERWDALRQFPAPALDLPAALVATRVLLVIVGAGAMAWLITRMRLRGVLNSRKPGTSRVQEPPR